MYDKKFVSYYDFFKEDAFYQSTISKLVSLFEPYTVSSVLDIGCGTGKIDKLLSEKGFEVIGLDASQEMIDYANTAYPEIPFYHLDARTFKIEGSFDAIIALDSVLTFLTKNGAFEDALRNIVAHMKKGSILFFNTGFTEELIPKNFSDNSAKEISIDGVVYRKHSSMFRGGDLLISQIQVFVDDTLVIEETHTHRILSEDLVVRLLRNLGCEVEIHGNSKQESYREMEVIAKKF